MKKIMLAFVLIVGFCCTTFAQSQTYTVLRRLSLMKFEVSAQMHMVHGESRSFSGTITGDPSDITAAQINVKLDPSTLNTDNEKRDAELREKCLEVLKFPAIEFVSSSITSDQKSLADGQTISADIKGTLKMHGLEKEMTVPVKIRLEKDVLTAEGSMAVVLDEWKILRPKVMVVQLQNDVKIDFTVGARRNP